MNSSKQKQLRKWGHIIAINLIPVIGVIFFEWGIFELATTYFLETGVIFIVFFIDRFFIDKKTRYPFIFASIQLFFLIFSFGGLLYGWAILTFHLTHKEYAERREFLDEFVSRLENLNLFWIILGFFVFEAINYFVKNSNGRNDKSASVWFNMQKILVIHLFVILCAFIFSFLPHNLVTGLFFIIAFKAVLDYVLETEKLVRAIDKFFGKIATIGLNDDGTAKKDKD